MRLQTFYCCDTNSSIGAGNVVAAYSFLFALLAGCLHCFHVCAVAVVVIVVIVSTVTDVVVARYSLSLAMCSKNNQKKSALKNANNKQMQRIEVKHEIIMQNKILFTVVVAFVFHFC